MEGQGNPFLKVWVSQHFPLAAFLFDELALAGLSIIMLGGVGFWMSLSFWKKESGNSKKPIVTSPQSPRSIPEAKMGGESVRSQSPPKNTFFRLLSYVRRYWPYASVVGITMVASTALDLVQPWILGFLLIGDVILQRNLSLLPWILALLVGAYVAKEVVGYLQQYFTEVLSQKTIHALRYDLFTSLEGLPVRFFDNNRAGELVSRIISDTEEVDNVMSTGISGLVANSVTVISVFILLFYVNSTLALYVVPAVAALAVVVNLFKKTIKASSRRIRQAVGDLAARVNETIGGIRIVKSFSMERHEAEKFQKQSMGILRSKVGLAKRSQLYSSATDLMTAAAVLIVIAIGTPSVVSGSLALGALIAFLAYVDKLFKPIISLSKANIDIQKANAAGERIFEIIDGEPETEERPDAIEPSIVKGHIVFDRVSFSYEPKRKVLEDFTLEVLPEEKLAIVGRSGVGKSTLVSLLLRFYEPSSGRILIDGQPINAWKLSSLRQKIAVVLQDPVLFSGTIRDNISYGNINASDEEIVDAAKTSNAHDFIIRLPHTYNTDTGERGVKLSSGERQRITIARALIKNPAILILDEATSNVDSESEALIQQALKLLTKGRTTIIIAHRLSTIKDADKIVVLDEDGIAEVGTHQQLLAREGAYSRLYEAQLKPQLSEPPHAL